MSIRQLRTFVAISETGSFAAAADRVFVSQAAVSQQMRSLEENLQVQLFDRTGRSPVLTQVAKAIVPRARAILREYDRLSGPVSAESELSGELVIGAVPSAMSRLMPLSLKNLYRQFPAIHIRVTGYLSSDLLPQVDRGAIDAAIMSEPHQQRAHFNWQAFASEELMVVCSREIEAGDPVAILTNQPYIRMARRAWISALADDILEEYKLDLQDVMELDSLETIISMVSHNLGAAIIPKPCVPGPLAQQLRFIPIGSPPRSRMLGILSRNDNSKYELIRQLHTALTETVDSATEPALT